MIKGGCRIEITHLMLCIIDQLNESVGHETSRSKKYWYHHYLKSITLIKPIFYAFLSFFAVCVLIFV